MQNRFLDFWCVLDWANPGCLGGKENFAHRFEKPILQGQRFDVTKRELATGRKSKYSHTVYTFGGVLYFYFEFSIFIVVYYVKMYIFLTLEFTTIFEFPLFQLILTKTSDLSSTVGIIYTSQISNCSFATKRNRFVNRDQ